MKKEVITIFIFLFLISSISAVELDMKTNYSQSETLIAAVSGSFTKPILPENIFFYRNTASGGSVRIPLIYDIAKIDEEFYIYALLPGNSGNYSISIKNAKYLKSNQISSEEIKKEFFINDKTADFSINPGFIITKEDFFIKVQNLQDTKINLQVKIGKEKEQKSQSILSSIFSVKNEDVNGIEVKSGEIKKLNFELKDLNKSRFEFITLKTNNTKYEIPIYITSNQTIKEQIKEFRFSPEKIDISLLLNSNKTKIFYIYNTGQLEISSVGLSISDSLKPYVSISQTSVEKIDAGSNFKIDLFILPQKKEKTIEGNITAKTEDKEISLPIKIIYSKSEIVKEEDYTPTVIQNCSKLGGKVCTKDEKCNGESVDALDAKCCLKDCVKTENTNIKWIGIIIILVVIGVVYWFFATKYSSRTKREINLLKPGRN